MDRSFQSPFINPSYFPDYDINKIPEIFSPLIISQSYREIQTKSLADDFYSNLLDWHNDKIYFAIEDTVYIHDFHTSKTSLLQTIYDNNITCVKGIGTKLLLGTSSGHLHTLDLIKNKINRNLVHKSRIGVIKIENNTILTGSRDKKIKLIDTRSGKITSVICQHSQEVCGMDLNKNFKTLVTGGNDNKMYIFDYRNLDLPLKKCNQHKAAVKGISFSPLNTNLFVTGGGSADKTVKLWDMSLINNTNNNLLVKSTNYGSQICNLKWLRNNQILSTHGYSKDDIRMCGSYDFQCTRQFLGHRNRVIHFSVSEDEKYFVTGSSDCNIRFWEIYGETRKELEIR
ncbi:APC/C activator protein (CDH1) [Vairimorpha necatrix]|uniref:APC/C activator protein (CDH1) n=1 Tax=Vairimorpha necatrix TaxID=6039 RepID=A0AAX4JCB3_9MICR